MKKKSLNKVFFQDFTETEIAEVLELGQIISYPKDTVIFKRGDESNGFYIISNGELEVFTHEKGEKVSIAIIKSGSVVGEIGFLDGQERTASATAVSDLVALRISPEDFTKIETTNTKLAIKLIIEIETILADRLRHSDKLLIDYHTVKIDEQFLQKIDLKLKHII